MNKAISVTEFIEEAHKQSKGKTCYKCKEHKPLSEFHKNKNTKGGFDYRCKPCIKEYQANLCPFKKWFSNKKGHAIHSGKVSVGIGPEDIPGVKIRETITEAANGRKYTSWEAIEYPKVCPVLGIKLDWSMNGKKLSNSPSLDRIDNTKGYIPGNVILISDLANSMKRNATLKQLKQFSRYHLFGNKNE